MSDAISHIEDGEYFRLGTRADNEATDTIPEMTAAHVKAIRVTNASSEHSKALYEIFLLVRSIVENRVVVVSVEDLRRVYGFVLESVGNKDIPLEESMPIETMVRGWLHPREGDLPVREGFPSAPLSQPSLTFESTPAAAPAAPDRKEPE